MCSTFGELTLALSIVCMFGPAGRVFGVSVPWAQLRSGGRQNYPLMHQAPTTCNGVIPMLGVVFDAIREVM